MWHGCDRGNYPPEGGHMSKPLTRFAIFALAGGMGFALTEQANAQSVPQIVQQSVNSAVQSVIQNIRDQIQSGATTPIPGGQVYRFAPERSANEQFYDDVFGPLAYAPMATKSGLMMPAVNPPQWGLWGTASGNWQRSTVAGTTSN